jgi:bis(5'-nucleosidyl)-tetraphosphatase
MIHAAGCIVYRKSRGFLLLKKKDFWEFPKGKVDSKDADLLATAVRETREETGLVDLQILEGFHEQEHYKLSGQEKQVDYFLAVTHDNPKISSEHLGFGWFSAEEVFEYLSFPGKKHVMQKALFFLDEQNLLR